MNFVTILGFIAGLCTSLSMLPQLLKVIREKESQDISLFAFIVLLTGIVLWIVYGFLETDWPVAITNSAAFVINLLLLVYSLKYKK